MIILEKEFDVGEIVRNARREELYGVVVRVDDDYVSIRSMVVDGKHIFHSMINYSTSLSSYHPFHLKYAYKDWVSLKDPPLENFGVLRMWNNDPVYH